MCQLVGGRRMWAELSCQHFQLRCHRYRKSVVGLSPSSCQGCSYTESENMENWWQNVFMSFLKLAQHHKTVDETFHWIRKLFAPPLDTQHFIPAPFTSIDLQPATRWKNSVRQTYNFVTVAIIYVSLTTSSTPTSFSSLCMRALGSNLLCSFDVLQFSDGFSRKLKMIFCL